MSAILSGAMMLGVVFVVPHVHDAVGGTIDVVGALGLTVGLVAILVGVSKGYAWGWTSGRTLGAIVGGIVVLLVWARYELVQARAPRRPAGHLGPPGAAHQPRRGRRSASA